MGLLRRQMKDLAHPVQPTLAIHVDADLPGQDQGQGFEGVGVQVKPVIRLPLDDHGLAEAFVAKALLEGVLVDGELRSRLAGAGAAPARGLTSAAARPACRSSGRSRPR